MANPFGSFDIPQLRKQSVMQDWSTPIVDYSGGEMPVNYPPPSVGPVQDGAFPGMFGREYTPSMTGAQPTGPTAGAPPSQVAPPQVNTYGSGDSAKRLMETIGSIYTPEYTDRDRLRSLMDAAPERESPGWGRGLSAIAMGIGTKDPTQALANMEAINYAPHRRAMADWTAKTDPFLKTAELENRSNINERTLAGNVATAQTNADRYASQEKIAAGKQEVAEKNAESTRIRARASQYTASLGKGYQWDVTGPTLKKMNRDTGDIIDTGLPTGKMTEEDKIALQNEGKVDAARASGEAAIARTQAAGQGVFVEEGTGRKVRLKPDGSGFEDIPGAPEGALTKPGTPSSAGSGGGELEKDRVQQDKMEYIWSTSGDKAKGIMTKGTNGKYEWKKRPVVKEDSWFPGDQSVTQKQVDDYDDARRSVDPTYVPPKTAAAPPPPRESAPDLNFSNVPKPAGSTKGLGPPNVPKPFGSSTIIESRSGSAPQFNYEQNKIHPNNIRRTSKDGKIQEISVDGGKTWTRRR